MTQHFVTIALVELVPVLVLLAALYTFDSFKLVSMRFVITVVVAGGIAAGLSYFVGSFLIEREGLSFSQYSRLAAPFVEEALKGAILLFLFARQRIGFMIDAMILGVAAGAGFSAVESIYYALAVPEADLMVWIVRGLGTAIMHGGATAIFAVSAQRLLEQADRSSVFDYLPGFIAAVSIHAIFNEFVAFPVLSAAATAFTIPLLLMFIFDKSEHQTHDWLVHDYESHQHLMDSIGDGTFQHGAGATVLAQLAGRLTDDDIADIFAYIKIHTRLVLEAERLLLAREKGNHAELSSADKADFADLHRLERKIGRTTMLAIWPHLKFSRQELWELHRLEKLAAHAAA